MQAHQSRYYLTRPQVLVVLQELLSLLLHALLPLLQFFQPLIWQLLLFLRLKHYTQLQDQHKVQLL